MLTRAQQRIRRTGIGASEIAAVVGRCPFASALDVYRTKTDALPFRLRSAQEERDLEAGHRLEDAIARWAAAREGWTLRRNQLTLRARRHTWMLATPDYFVLDVHARQRMALCEVKTAPTETWVAGGAFGVFGAEGTDEIPDPYLCQVTWQMMVTRIPLAMVPVLFYDTRELRIYQVAFSRELAGVLFEAGERFWRRHVQRRVPPGATFERALGSAAMTQGIPLLGARARARG